MTGKYKVYGTYQNRGRPGPENCFQDLLGEFDTHEEAKAFAEIQRGAWDRVSIELTTNDERCRIIYEKE